MDSDESRRAEQTAQSLCLRFVCRPAAPAKLSPVMPSRILDLPSPWSERPDIPREKFHARCYQGDARRKLVRKSCLCSVAPECDLCCQEKTIFYHKCKVEQYAPYTQDDGLVQRITLYKAAIWRSEDILLDKFSLWFRLSRPLQDVRRQIPLEIRERFKHRKDKLFERKRRPMQNAPWRVQPSLLFVPSMRRLHEARLLAIVHRGDTGAISPWAALHICLQCGWCSQGVPRGRRRVGVHL